MSDCEKFGKQELLTYEGDAKPAKPLHNPLTKVFRSTLVAMSAAVASLGVMEVATAPDGEPGRGTVTRTVREALQDTFGHEKITPAENGRRMMRETLKYKEPPALTCCNENATPNDMCAFIVNQYIKEFYASGMSALDEDETRTRLLIAISENPSAVTAAWSDYVAAVHAHRNNPENWRVGYKGPEDFEAIGLQYKKDFLIAALKQHGIDAALRNSLADTAVAELSQLSTQ